MSFILNMSFTSLFLFFFGAIGIFNSFLTSLYFIFKKGKQKSNLFLGLFLFFISERALRSLIYFFAPQLPNAYSKSDAITFIFIGPFLFLYVLSIIKPTSKIVTYWKPHILCWVIVSTILIFKFPFLEDPIFWKKYILSSVNFQWLLYILSSGIIVFRYINQLPSAKEQRHPLNLWLILFLLSILILWCIYFFVNFSYFVIGSITFSALFYSFFLYFVFNKKERAKIFPNEKKYAVKRIDNSTETIIVKKLTDLMKEDKLYKKSNLKLKDLAENLELSSHQISQLLNDNLGKSFSEFINEYRIEEAKQLIRSNTKYTLEAIGNESGFNSKSMFYKYFKSIVGMTPKKYREEFLSSLL